MKNSKTLILIDGNHYLHVLNATVDYAEEKLGYSIAGALFLGEAGKLGSLDSLSELELPILTARSDFVAALRDACIKFRPEIVLDISGAPVLNQAARRELAGEALRMGISYVGPDFRYNALPRADISRVPTLTVLGAGKRVGKTAVCSYAARAIAGAGFSPVIITMGRGGPSEPLLIDPAKTEITPDFLSSENARGRHAASDNYEEALFTGLPTVGCFRAGGGIAGSPFLSTVESGARLANTLERDFHIFEGSGDTAPPVRTDAAIVVASANIPEKFLLDPFLSNFLRNAGMVVITGCEEPVASTEKVEGLIGKIRNINEGAKIITTVLRPQPSKPLEGQNVVLATSAPSEIKEKLIRHLESVYKCRISGCTTSLSDKGQLKRELDELRGAGESRPDVLLTELKAASIQVGLPMAAESGMDVVFCQNTPVSAEPEPGDLAQVIVELARGARKTYLEAHPEESKEEK